MRPPRSAALDEENAAVDNTTVRLNMCFPSSHVCGPCDCRIAKTLDRNKVCSLRFTTGLIGSEHIDLVQMPEPKR